MPTPSPSLATATCGRLLVLAVPQRHHLTVLVAGEADLASAPLLREQLVDSLTYRPRTMVLDAEDLTFCDLRGLDAIVDAVALAERSGVQVTLRPSPQLAWLVATVRQAPRTGGQPALHPSGCPLPLPFRRTA